MYVNVFNHLESQKTLHFYQQHKESMLVVLHSCEAELQNTLGKYSNLSQVETELETKNLLKEKLSNLLESHRPSLQGIPSHLLAASSKDVKPEIMAEVSSLFRVNS